MKHTVTRRVAAGALSVLLAAGSLPTAAIAEALTTQGVGAWEHDGSAWHYRLPDGSLGTGWHDVDGTWYLFDAEGNMLTGWRVDGDTAYRLGDSGGMWRSRWACEDGEWWYLLPSGAAASGWRFVDGAWYYFDPASGMMLHDVEVDGCYLGPNGAWDDTAAPEVVLASVSTTDVVDPAATSAVITVTTDEAHPFAEKLDVSTLELAGDLDGAFTIKSVERTDTHTAKVSIEGAFKTADPEAGIVFAPGSFADPKAAAICSVGVGHTDALLLVDESSYDEASDSYKLVVDSGSAQALDSTGVSFPESWGAEVLGVQSVPGSRRAEVSVKFAEGSAEDFAAALEAALEGDGMKLTGTTAGDILVGLSDETYESLAAYLAPNVYFYVERGADGKGWRETEGGGAEVVLRLRMEEETGSVNLRDVSVALAGETEDEDFQAEDWSFVDDNTLEFVADRLSAEELAQAKVDYGIDDTAVLLDAYAYALGAMASGDAELTGDLTDAWGAEMPEGYSVTVNVFNNVGLGETGEVEDPFADTPLETQAESDAEKHAKESLGRTERAAKNAIALGMIGPLMGSVGSIVGNFFTFTDANKSNYLFQWTSGLSKQMGTLRGLAAGASTAGLLGTVGMALSKALSPTNVGIDDLMAQTVSMQAKASEISGQLGAISRQITALRDKLDFSTKVSKLTDLCSKADSYRPWVARAMNAGQNASDRLTFDIAKDDLENSESAKILRELRDQTKLQSKMNGGKLTAYNVADGLASLIVGDPKLGVKGVVESYFDYTASQVNWDSEAFNARVQFVNYVSYAFMNAYQAAMNELKWSRREAEDEDEQEMYDEMIGRLYVQAADVASLIGDRSNVTMSDGKKGQEGMLLSRTKDRTDGKVLCTVNGRLYTKTRGSTEHTYQVYRGTKYVPRADAPEAAKQAYERGDTFALSTIYFWCCDRVEDYETRTYYTSDNPALRPALISSNSKEFWDCFDTLLKERDEEDAGNHYSNPSTMSASDFETMVQRLPNVRKMEGFSSVNSIYDELIGVDILAQNHGKVSSDRSGLGSYSSDYVSVSWNTGAQYYWALTGDTSITNKADSPSISHVRVFSADMFDMTANKSLGKQLFYKYDCWFKGTRWRVTLDIVTPMVFN